MGLGDDFKDEMILIIRRLKVSNKYSFPVTNHDSILKARFGSRVREFRHKFNLSQESLADKAGLDRTYIGGIERGERNPSLVNILKISRALGVDPAELFSGWVK